MRVSICTIANSDVGLGHLSRCGALIPSLIAAGADVNLFVEADENLISFVDTSMVRTFFVKNKDDCLFRLKQNSPVDVLICDRPDLTEKDSKAHYMLGARRIILLASSSISRYECDFAFIDDPIFVEESRVLAKYCFSGIGFHIIQPGVLALRPASPLVLRSGGPFHLLVALSGSDPGEITEELVSSLCEVFDLGNCNCKVSAVAGPGWSNERRVNFHRSVSTAVNVIDSPLGLGELILSSDVVVTMGGRTSYEVFALGRPLFCLPWPTTRRYVVSLNKLNLAMMVEENPRLAAVQIFRALQNPSLLNANARRAFSIIKDDAADRVASLCLKGF